MSHKDKLEQVLEYIINEEADAASALLHQIVVSKARDIYEELVNDEEEEVELEEDFGGDQTQDFIDDVSDESAEGGEEEGEFEGFADEEVLDQESEEGVEGEEVEDRVEDLESALASLRAEFDALMSQEAEEPNHDFGGDEFGSEESVEDEEVFEATKFSTDVNVEVNGEKDAQNKQSPYTKAPSKQDFGGQPVKFAKSAKDGKEVSDAAQKQKAPTNMGTKQANTSVSLDGEGKLAGAGKTTPVQTKSPLGKK